jgi:ClpP class serine protease
MTMCGEAGTSYQSLVDQVEEMADAGVKTIIMEVSSGGGEASHCFEAAADIRAIADENGIELIGYADTLACSAAYALLCVCDSITANPSATVGSVGCVVALMDTSKAMEQAGLKRVFITSGDNKVPFAADGSFKKEFLDEIQADVNRLNVEFASHVSVYTGLDIETIMGFQAKTFSADEALKLGLVNAVMTSKQFAAHVAAKQGLK